jgi:hypothetical protein
MVLKQESFVLREGFKRVKATGRVLSCTAPGQLKNTTAEAKNSQTIKLANKFFPF